VAALMHMELQCGRRDRQRDFEKRGGGAGGQGCFLPVWQGSLSHDTGFTKHDSLHSQQLSCACSSSTAVNLGYVIFIVGWIMQVRPCTSSQVADLRFLAVHHKAVLACACLKSRYLPGVATVFFHNRKQFLVAKQWPCSCAKL